MVSKISQGHQFWTRGTLLGDKRTGYCPVYVGDVIAVRTHDFEEAFYLQLCIGYDHQIFKTITLLK